MSYQAPMDIYQVTDRVRVIRGIGLSLNWTFGKPAKEKTTDLIGTPPAE